jgi:hypothetical protein
MPIRQRNLDLSLGAAPRADHHVFDRRSSPLSHSCGALFRRATAQQDGRSGAPDNNAGVAPSSAGVLSCAVMRLLGAPYLPAAVLLLQ